ncbi:hypothetical protein NQ315_013358 [Exocentrus adspersus]|uniref:E3 ubiquitin-protein ligase MYCBP2 n=1 Tax=Exocentrus adspersus TaxID=1586481 RepID=A0AAV8VRZ3_9CUCU|nr:hypothetical protein NQ315_013358 [Exocentrus adspersus]
MLPGPEDFGILYHEIYNGSSNLKKKVEWKKLKKKLTNYQCNVRNKIDLLYENDTKAPRIELPKNASAFAVFASVRLAILDRWMYGVNQEHWQSSCNKIPILEQTEIESDTEDNFHTCHLPITVSKVVSLGLRSVFELIKESRITHPSLCTKALLALLNVLQGQPPEGLKSEPSEVTDPLFELLLDLATLHGPESSVPNDGSHLTAVSCACLLSLVVARGETGKYLSATAALLMCPRALSFQNIKMPSILCSLQRSVYAVLLEKCTKPEWITHGVTSNSKIDSFCIKLPSELIGVPLIVKSLCCDGQYFYLFTSKGLLKIGCGFGGTEKGTIMLWKADFYPNDNGVLLYCGGHLYLKLCGRRGDEFLIVDKTNLLIIGSVLLHNKDASSPIIFSDGDYLGIISPTKDDAFVVRMLNYNTSPASVISELPIKLAKKCVEVCGTAFFDDEVGNYSVNIGNEEVDLITAGKEFGLISTVTGKVFYCGKSSALGIKQAGIRSGKWSELILTQSPKVNHIAVGHDGLHAIIITEDGSVFFYRRNKGRVMDRMERVIIFAYLSLPFVEVGTARRGEDGDQNKVRRQPKPVKPRKIIRVDGHHIISGACNNGTTALINENGELIMFGKDTTHADPTTGIVTSLKDEFITQVALGKAHTVALTNKGQVYTFGINNKHQCGRDFNSSKSGNFSQVVAMDTCGVHEEHDFYNETDINHPNGVDKNITKAISSICPPGTHSWHDDMCMVCSVCRECTGYSVSCLSSISPDRNPGQVCGCGEGDSGCAICGCCRICAREVMDNSELADLGGIIKFDLIFHNKTSSLQHQRCKLQEQMRIRLDEKKNKSKRFVQGLSKQPIKSKSSKSGSNVVNITGRTSGTGQTDGLEMCTEVFILAKDQSGSDIERDTSRVSCLPPAKISLPPDSPVIQIACGLHHTILLLQNGQVKIIISVGRKPVLARVIGPQS